jgi:hypothetical protein
MIEVKSSIFGFGELLCCTCFCCECPTVIFSHNQELAATNWLEGISVESLGVWEGDFGTVVILEEILDWLRFKPLLVFFLGPSEAILEES